jgi:hypothetical protein
LPAQYTVGFFEDGETVSLGSVPLIHPSWWPSLPIAIGVGVAIGIGIGFIAHLAGVRITRGTPPGGELATGTVIERP